MTFRALSNQLLRPSLFLSTAADNRDIVCADACKDALYVLAHNHGINSPEEFGILVSNHFLSTYSHMTRIVLNVDEFRWNRISYDDEAEKLHNHAFIHKPDCTRTCSVTLDRKGIAFIRFSLKNLFISLDMVPRVVSGIKNLRLIKTDQATFVGFHRDAYRTLPELHERILRLSMGSWQR